MPRKKRSQSASEAAEIHNLAKRQRGENESEAKTNAEPRPATAETTSRASLIEEEWTIGSPLPTGIIPPSFLPSSQFQAQAVKKLDRDKKLAAVRKWILSESRPSFARLLCSEKLQEDNELLAAYLGFDTVPQLCYFAYFDVTNTLNHLLRIQYEDYRRRASMTNTYTNPRDSIPPASKVWKLFKVLLKGDLNWLKLALDTSHPDQILVSSRPSQQKLIGDENNITIEDIDPTLSILAASYKLAKAHPNRFCQQQPQKLVEYSWGLHHEDWMRAYAVITFACKEYIWFAFRFEDHPDATMFGAYMDLSQDAREPESFGYITDELLPQVKTSKRLGRMTTTPHNQEIDFPKLQRDITEMENLSRLATKDEIKYTINTLFQSKTATEGDLIVQDTDAALSEIIIEAVCTTLSTIAPGTDSDEKLDISDKMKRSQITESERKDLLALLRSRVCRTPYEASKQTAPKDHHCHDDHQSARDAAGATQSDKAKENIPFNGNIDLENLRKTRAQLGEFLPSNQDLTNICRLRGIDVDTFSISPLKLKLKARAPQVIGMLFFLVI